MIGGNKGAILLGRHHEKPDHVKSTQSELIFPDDSAIRKKSPAALIAGKTPHMLELTSNRFVPGPGKYNPKDVRNDKGVKFMAPSRSNKSKDKRRNLTPGPGAYKIKDDFGLNAKSVSIQGRHEEYMVRKNKLHFTPGPGAYNIDRFNKTAGPSFSIKGAVSEDPIMREKQKVPAS